MASYTIFMSNLGYLRGINGCLSHHMLYAPLHVYCPPYVQQKALHQLSDIIAKEDPDICCFVEIEKNALNTHFDRIAAIATKRYPFFDMENKYGLSSWLRKMPITRGKSNGFIAKQAFPHEKIYFDVGTKRLIYKITLEPKLTLFFTHFSLKKAVREAQLNQMRKLLSETVGEIILLGDFNILTGFKELAPLLHENNLTLLSQEDAPTFTFHRTRMALDICICTHNIAQRAELRILPQPFSDHDALVLKVNSHG